MFAIFSIEFFSKKRIEGVPVVSLLVDILGIKDFPLQLENAANPFFSRNYLEYYIYSVFLRF
ncbi:hypothetical protein GPB2148_1572 [marine gamma proteobacterium HTCC2148]|nr:hypothetical protein GPB2148_1572 [marine gamma proteobacterium HTCC2148]